MLILPHMKRTHWLTLFLTACLACGLFLGGAQRQSKQAPPSAESQGEQATPEREAAAPSARESRLRHLTSLGVDRWHEHGWRGRGVKVAVLDTGFRGYRAFLGKQLPSAVRVRSFRRDGQLEARPSQHGVLCAEIIHAIAPDAEILFANWEPDEPDTFLEAVRWARKEGARLISCSVIMPSWSDGHGGGAVHHRLAALLGAAEAHDGMFLCACAGNTAQRHWAGIPRLDSDGWHYWHSKDRRNLIVPWGGERVAVEMYGAAGVGCRIQVVKKGEETLVGEAEVSAPSAALLPTAVRFDPERGQEYEVRLKSGTKAAPGAFHVVVLGGDLQHTTPKDSIAFPGDGEPVFTVGAVDAAGRRKLYSSCGPTGRRAKPDFAAQVPFVSLCRAESFSGTSAAAPQAAGLAALILGRHPDWSRQRVHDFLRVASEDLHEPGHDCETGYGLLRLPAP